MLTIADGLVCLSLSLRISFSMLSLMASLHARWQISVRSAPEKPLVILARKSKSTSYQTETMSNFNFYSVTISKSHFLLATFGCSPCHKEAIILGISAEVAVFTPDATPDEISKGTFLLMF